MQRDPAVLASLGLHRGELVRFKRLAGHKWSHGTLSGIEADGCLALTDANGAARSIPTSRVEVRRKSGRNAKWCPVDDVATTWEQLSMF